MMTQWAAGSARFWGVRCYLVRIFGKRFVEPGYVVREQSRVAFADGHPFLLTNEASLRKLNESLDKPVDMSRFRPNLVISSSEPFIEDSWKKVKIGENLFCVVKPCSRCVVTTIDQKSGQKLDDEPLRTLSKVRMFSFKGKNKILFGQDLIT